MHVRLPPPAHKEQSGGLWRRSASLRLFGKSGIELRVQLRGGWKQSCMVYVNVQRDLWEGCELAGEQRMGQTCEFLLNAVAKTRFRAVSNYSIRKTKNLKTE